MVLIALSERDAEVLQELLQQKVLELGREINRTDSLAFKEELHGRDRALERIVTAVTAALGEPIEA